MGIKLVYICVPTPSPQLKSSCFRKVGAVAFAPVEMLWTRKKSS
jgi:hypothetical protein